MRHAKIAAIALAAFMMGCATVPDQNSANPAAAIDAAGANPFYEDWSALPFGAPPFDRIRTEHFEPAFVQGFAEHDFEIQAIANNPEAPSFDNTITAMELSGQTLSRVASVFFNLSGSDATEDIQALERDIAPQWSRHYSAISLNQPLFARIDALYQQRDAIGLNSEQRRLLERYHLNFVRDGAQLDETGRARLAAIDEQLANLYTTFGQNMLADTADWTLTLGGEEDLAGLPQSLRAAALQAGADLGREGEYVITLQRSSVEPFLQYSDRRDLREQAFKAWAARGENGDEEDNRAVIRQILELRTERAHLLGFANFAAYALADRMAGTPEAAYDLMRRVWTPAVARANEERADMQAMIESEGGDFQLEAWDWRYYAEKVRLARYDIDPNEVRPYLQYERLLEGAFNTANRLFGLTFVPRPDLPKYHPDVRVFEVRNAEGDIIGLYYNDPYMRPTKQSGAWMNSFRDQYNVGGGSLPVIVNVMNYSKPEPGAPTLLSWDDAETMFHEFGHALHGLLSQVDYPSMSGTSVPRDYVEFPSQVMEHWFAEEETLTRFAIHAETGEPMPRALMERLHAADQFNQGFATVEYLASAIVDMDLHMQNQIPDDFDITAFEQRALADLGMPNEIIMRHRPTHFGHVFSGDGYSAGYYGYLWAEVLDADAFEAFEETGDPFNPELAARFRDYVFAAGNLRDPMEAYVLFRGREPDPAALLRARGFAPPLDSQGAN